MWSEETILDKSAKFCYIIIEKSAKKEKKKMWWKISGFLLSRLKTHHYLDLSAPCNLIKLKTDILCWIILGYLLTKNKLSL